MSLHPYTKSITSDFGGTAPNYGQLQEEIDELGLSSALNNIEPPIVGGDGDTITFNFESVLSTFSPNDLSTFNNYISGYSKVDSQDTISSFSSISFIGNEKIEATHPTLIAEFTYPGSQKVGKITDIKISSYMGNNCTNYTITIIDPANGKQIASTTLTNTSKQLNSLGAISNIPKLESEFEIYANITTTKKNASATISSITIYHE